MRDMNVLRIALLFCLCLLLPAADWINSRGDAARTGWQKRERYFKPANIKDLKLLWKYQLGAGEYFTAPIIIGPFVSHRGIKELIFTAGSRNDVYAVDADLGRLFWKQQIEPAPSSNKSCGGSLTAGMALEPDLNPIPAHEDDDDYHARQRPLYFLTGTGMLHMLLPATGQDNGPIRRFLPANANAGDLTFSDDKITTLVTGSCPGVSAGVWTMDKKTGKVSTSALQVEMKNEALWNGSDGLKWRYAVTPQVIQAYHNGKMAWTNPVLNPAPAVVAAGVVFVLGRGDSTKGIHAVLNAYDAVSGKRLYSSGEILTSAAPRGAIALANGHIAVIDENKVLYCFGFPIEIF